MKTLNKCLYLFLLLNLGYSVLAEKEAEASNEKYELKLKTGSFVPEVIDLTMQKRSFDMEKHCFDSYYYAVLQFNEIPNFQILQKLKLLDVQLGSYIPENAYRAKIATGVSLSMLKEFNVRSIYFIKPEDKISSKLLNKLKSNIHTTQEFETQISLRYDETLSINEVKVILNKIANEVEFDSNKNELFIRAKESEIKNIAKLPFIYFIDEYESTVKFLAESATVQTRGRYFHNMVSGILPKLTGKGIKIAVMDGITNHVDLKNRGTASGCLSLVEDGNHGCLTRGLVGGNGNINPDLMGMAPESIVTDGTTYHINDAAKNGALASVHPYPLWLCPHACPKGRYSTGSQTYDLESKQNPNHLAVVSAGNQGRTYLVSNITHDYPDHFNTLSGVGQTSKNTLTVGGITNLDKSNLSASRGPTRDGRLKPELVAEACVKGPGANNTYGSICGTSFSAPIVAGGIALLGEAYVNLNIDEDQDGVSDLPKAGLLKAILCNTADDLGNPGPDFTFGFGRPNFKRAYESLKDFQYIKKDVEDANLFSNNFHNQHSISVPNNVTEVNVTLYWPDAEGNTNLGEEDNQLINDLDLYMYRNTESNLIHKPFVLNNIVSNKANADNPALIYKCDNTNHTCVDQNGNRISDPQYLIESEDHINNIEKITIKTPVAGNWTIGVKGIIKDGTKYQNQEYFVAYEFRYKDLELTYPRGGESFEPGEKIYITWEDMGNYTGYNIEYGDGTNWYPVKAKIDGTNYSGLNLPVDRKFYKWDIPQLGVIVDQNTTFDHGRYKIRVSGIKMDNTLETVMTDYINIMTAPILSHNYINNQTTPFQLSWNPILGASKYEIYKLGDQEMEPLTNGQTVNTSFTINHLPFSDIGNWYSVVSIKEINQNGELIEIPSERAYAIEIKNNTINNIPYVKIYLEGAYDEDLNEHHTTLNTKRKLLPGMDITPQGQPYNITPWNYMGTEGNDFNSNSYEATDVDWVLVSIRADLKKEDEVLQIAGLLQKDGTVKFLDVSPFVSLENCTYYIVVEHRNHLPTMSSYPVKIKDGNFICDFTLQDSYRTTTKNGQKLLSNGKWVAIAGNASQDNSNAANPLNYINDIDGQDKWLWSNNNGVSNQYKSEDMDLDGDITGADKIIWFKNFGLNCAVPQ